ncbi:hypothetical protein [Methylovulum miyakonense]|uniref:hypothetical protein n=1 Tax=Methylovulum miyakonense TaxID=645578 RepID=UPI0018DE1AD0|nr:hypothetical protein [Methylovulum miyakonense]
MCDHNSVSCTFPLVANVEMKRCDLDCGNGSIIDPSTGAQCPACIGGQVRNPNTNVCEDPQCDPPKYLNTATHSCADEPNCIGGQTLDTSQVPHACLDPQCVSPQVLNLATRLCETPPDICQPGYTLVNGVCTLDQCQAPKVQCNFGGQQVCLTFCDGPNGTDGDGTDADSSGSGSGSGDGSGSGGGSGSGDGSGSGSGSGSGETATPGTMTNPGGSIGNYTPPSFESLGAGMGTPSAQTSSGASVTSNSTAGTPAMGQFTPAISAPDPNLGKWYTPTTDTYQGVLSDTIAAIQQQPIMQFGQDIFDVQIGGGSCSPLVFPAVMGMDEITSDWICADFMEYFWPIIRAIVIGSAVFMAFRIALSGLS